MIKCVQNTASHNSYQNKPAEKEIFFSATKNIEQNQLVSLETSNALRASKLFQRKINPISFAAKAPKEIYAPYLRGTKPLQVGEITVIPSKIKNITSYCLKTGDQTLGNVSISKDCPIKARICETQASQGKSGKMVFLEFPEGATCIIPKDGYFKAKGIEVNLSGNTQPSSVSKPFSSNKNISFQGNFVVTTGHRASVVNTLVDKYFNRKLYEKLERPIELKHSDIDVVELTAGLGSRLAGITWVSKTNKPGIQLPYKNGYLMYNHIDNLFHSGIINEKTKISLMNDHKKTGAANHILLAHKKGLISGDQPVLVCSSDQIHDINFDEAIQTYKNILAESRKDPKKPFPIAMIISTPVKDCSGLGVIASDNDNKIQRFVEKPKTKEEAECALIRDSNGKSTETYRANTGIYILSPEFIQIAEKYSNEFRHEGTNTLDFGNDTLPRIRDFCEKGETIIKDKTIKEDLRHMTIYNYDAIGSNWVDVGGCLQDIIDTSEDMAKGKFKLPAATLKEIQNNVDVENRIVCTPEAKEILDSMQQKNQYGEIIAQNIIFVTKDKNIRK